MTLGYMHSSYKVRMHRLLLAAEQAYNEAPVEIRVQPSNPILYFGNLDAFRESKLRIVTVALNASKVEFPVNNPYLRFPAAAQWIDVIPELERTTTVATALNEYFAVQPYEAWFSNFENVLYGFNAGYYGDKDNTAIQ